MVRNERAPRSAPPPREKKKKKQLPANENAAKTIEMDSRPEFSLWAAVKKSLGPDRYKTADTTRRHFFASFLSYLARTVLFNAKHEIKLQGKNETDCFMYGILDFLESINRSPEN